MKQEVIEISAVNKEVYDRLRKQITQAMIVPGERISLRQIAAAFGVSTMPVREALRQLQAEGFIRYENRSVVVRQLTLAEVEEVFEIRISLETLATERALPKINQSDIEQLMSILVRMDAADINHAEWLLLNRQFHLQFYTCSDSPHLIQLIRNVWDTVEPYMNIYTSSVSSLHQAMAEHHELLGYIQERKLKELLQLTLKHLKYTFNVIKSGLEK